MIGYGATLWRSSDNVIYRQITGLIEVSPPELSRAIIDNTEPESEFPSYLVGQKKYGDVTIKIDAESAHRNFIIQDYTNGNLIYYRLDYGENFRVYFTGYVTSVKDDTPISSRITRSATISISGTPTFEDMRG